MASAASVLDPQTGGSDGERSVRSGIGWGLFWVGLVVVVMAVARNARRPGDLAARVRNAAISGHPRPVASLWGIHNWMSKLQTGTVIVMVILAVAFVVLWRRYPRHPILLMAIAAEGIVWLDPIMNWAPYAVYNPQLWHWPESWPLASLAPTIEPFVVFGYVMFYFAPYFPAIWVLRRLQRGRPESSLVRRRPLLCLGVLTFVIGFVFDAALEIFCIRAGLYIYSQVVPFGSIFTGKAYQFPLLWESSLVTDVMITSAVLLYKYDDGVRVVERIAGRVRVFASRPALRLFVVMFAMLNVSYLTYGLGFAILRWSGAATSVACPYPYPESKVYDPQGLYAKAGQPGPYLGGNWNGWESLHSGRPDTVTAATGRCSPTSVAAG